MTDSPRQLDFAYVVSFWLLLLLFCAWIVYLPVFPSQDGPVHVYYADVAEHLFSGRGSFSAGFRVQHAFPPYSLHCYLLMLALRVASPAMSEKLLACLCVLIAGGGFFYFARQLGRAGALLSVLAAPLFLHRYLFFGFFGYAMGIGFALLAIGIWCRPDRASWRRRAAFLLLAVLTAFTHPVPYGLLMACCASEAILAAALWKRAAQGWVVGLARPRWTDAAALAVAALPLAYIARFAHSGTLWTRYSGVELWANVFRIFEVFQMYIVVPLDVTAYRVPLRTVLLAFLVLAVWKTAGDWRARRFTHSQLALAWGVLMLLALPFMPGALNGSFIFAERLAVWPALFILLSASNLELEEGASKLVFAAGVLIGIFSLALLNLHLGPIARQIDVANQAPAAAPGVHAVLVDDSNPPLELTFNPYLWAGVRLAEQQRAILVNSPWLDLSIMMLKPSDPDLYEEGFMSNPRRVVHRFGSQSMIVVAHCGDFGVKPSMSAWMRSTYARHWKFSQQACFDLLQPGS